MMFSPWLDLILMWLLLGISIAQVSIGMSNSHSSSAGQQSPSELAKLRLSP